jgi:hypothetical protein
LTNKRPTTELPKKARTVTRKKNSKKRCKKQVSESSMPEITRVDDYAKHLKNTRSLLPDSVGYLVADGYYCRAKFWDAVRESDLNLISKLRVDANLNYLYAGEKNKLGAPRKYDGKVDCNNLNNLTFIKEIKQVVKLYSLVVWSCCLKCKIRLASISELQTNGKKKMFYYLALISISQPSKYLSIIKLVFKLNSFFVMPNNLLVCPIANL